MATSEVAAGAIGLTAGTISAISTGVATAAPAELDAAIPAVPSPPPISLSAIISGIPVTIITATPNRIPNRPVCAITLRSMVLPSAKAKKGISVWTALLKNSRSSGSRLPSVKPTRKGSTAPTNTCGSNDAIPAVPRMIIVISGPDSSDIRTNAPASSLVPYCCIMDAYSPPLVMSIAATSASVDSPAKNPASTPCSGIIREAIAATTHATAILVTTSVPDLRRTVPVALSLMEAPMQKNHTARIGTVPVIIPLVNEPKYFPASGENV
ncbi:hypothetical protein SDC9_141728 [bioreactor metagenome]|uniref:Uncharacterized protein n=1 Tax=bioreactor metagenome TaxID=1076179 RepID=A0A645E1W7_9ZZZZ